MNSQHERRMEDGCGRRGEESEGELHYQSPRNTARRLGCGESRGLMSGDPEIRSPLLEEQSASHQL